MEVKTNIIKRNGKEVSFDITKITNAIRKANEEVDKLHRLNDYQIEAIGDMIAQEIDDSTHAVNVEDIQDMVETGIMGMRGYEVAQKYVRYRYKREITRKSNTTDNGILALLDHINEEVKQEILIRIRSSTLRREIIWQARSARIFPDVYSFRRRS